MRYYVVNNKADEENQSAEKHAPASLAAETIDFGDGGGKPADLARLVREKIRRREVFCSFELFPTKDPSVYQRFFKETQSCNPLFYSLTWHCDRLGGELEYPSLKCAEHFPGNTLLHCAARGLKLADLELIINRARDIGIINIFALQGDGNAAAGELAHASDLVGFIRERVGQAFSICVAGYPEMHPQSPSKQLDLQHLKAKVDAGADFIITQMFFEARSFIEFEKDCRAIGITVPILPGIYPFTSAKLLRKMSTTCQVNVPLWLQAFLDDNENDTEAITKFGIDLSVKIIKEIIDSGASYAFHLFTLNKSFSAVEICRQLSVEV